MGGSSSWCAPAPIGVLVDSAGHCASLIFGKESVLGVFCQFSGVVHGRESVLA